MTAVLELENLGVRFGTRDILRNLNCNLQGRTIGLLGPNGAGKSTLINTLLGFYPATFGTARVFGYDIRTQNRQIRTIVGYMPENDSFIANLTGVAFIRLMAELSGLPSEAALERAHEALFYVGLGEARYRRVGTYSQGMKQLAKLAQAIVHGPKLLVLDEPTNALDPPARQRMIRLIKEMRDTHEMHIVVCSHLLKDVEDCCEEVMILRDGQLVQVCNLEEERRLNRRFLEMETIGAGDEFVNAIESLGCECAMTPDKRVKVVLADNVEVRDIYRLAAERDIQVRRLSYRKDTLEDIFLKAMDSSIAAVKEVPQEVASGRL